MPLTACGRIIGAPVWPPVGGGSAMGSDEERGRFLSQVRKACAIGQKLRKLGIRKYGVVRIDSAEGPPHGLKSGRKHKTDCRDFSRGMHHCRRHTASGSPQRERSAGAECTAGSTWSNCWRWSIARRLLASRQIWLTRCFIRWAITRLRAGFFPQDYDWSDSTVLTNALRQVANALRPWTIDFHVAQNDGTVKGSGSHDKTGRHCPPDDPNGKMDIVEVAGLWMRNQDGSPTRAYEHICWDGCMFPNAMMTSPETWVKILATLVQVRDAHGWD